MNDLSRWLRMKRGRLRDVPLKIGDIVFHIPFDGSEYLLFKCAKCGFCCRSQRYGALLLTYGDIERLSKAFNNLSTKDFLEKECIRAQIQEKEVYPVLSGPPVAADYIGYFLKRFDGENKETIMKPYPCRFLTEDNLCSIYDVRPTVCKKFPYTVYKTESLYHAYYVVTSQLECKGYRAKRKIKKKWLSEWAKPLIDGGNEVIETVEKRLMKITELKFS